MGDIATAGTFAYALGKFGSGILADTLGGRRNMLLGMAGAVLCTLLFATGGSLGVFAAAWFGNRLLQSLGWPAMVRIAARWFSPARYGAVMGVLSLSFLFGDSAAQFFISRLYEIGLGWRQVFIVAAGTLATILLAGFWLLKESPESIGEKPPGPGVDEELLAAAEPERPVLRRLLSSPTFGLNCLLSLSLTFLRETFNLWTPTYFVNAVGLAKPDAVAAGALFPLAGGVSVIIAGLLSDRLGRSGRMVVVSAGLAAAGVLMAILARGGFGGSTLEPVALVISIAFLLIGPYSYLAGAVSLDYGGKAGGASASGLIDGVGYIGGMLAGWGMARVSIALGWGGAFGVLAGAAWASSGLALVILWAESRRTGRLRG
jgi:OPA family glycerol-3-phosphate transporter-like MFS transporter